MLGPGVCKFVNVWEVNVSAYFFLVCLFPRKSVIRSGDKGNPDHIIKTLKP